jgi:hypothetical protein
MNPYPRAIKLLQYVSVMTSFLLLAQLLYLVIVHNQSTDSQAAGMLADLMIGDLSNYLLGMIFIILSLSNIFIKRGLIELKSIRLPSLILTAAIVIPSYILIPRMDYLRETALASGFPVMLSPFARYFFLLNATKILMLVIQIFCSLIISWRLRRLSLA